MLNLASITCFQKSALKTFLLILGVFFLFKTPFLQNVYLASQDEIINDDARIQIACMLPYSGATHFRGDLATEYNLGALPIGYKFLYFSVGKIISVKTLSKILPYLLFIVFLVAMGLLGARFAGFWGAFLAISLSFGSHFFLERMIGGLPRAFSYPVIAWALVSLLYEKPKLLVACVWGGALFFPRRVPMVELPVRIFLLLTLSYRSWGVL